MPDFSRIPAFCPGAGLKNHSRNLYAPLCGRFRPHSVDVARYAALIQTNLPQIVAYISQKAFSKPALAAYLLFYERMLFSLRTFLFADTFYDFADTYVRFLHVFLFADT